MGDSDRLVELVEACKLRRLRTGATKRERAQIEIVDGPPIPAKSCATPAATQGTSLTQSKHWMVLPAPEPKPRQRGLGSK